MMARRWLSILAVAGSVSFVAQPWEPVYWLPTDPPPAVRDGGGTGRPAAPGETANRARVRNTAAALAGSSHSTEEATTRDEVIDRYGRLPLSFHPNAGQTDPEVRFTARGPGYALFLTETDAVLRLDRVQRAETNRSVPPTALPSQTSSTLVRMRLVDAKPSRAIIGLDELPGKAHYYVGSDRSKWRANVSTYARVRYRDVYPGIDLTYYGNPQQLEYDLVVQPGADPSQIALAFEGTDRIDIAPDGHLLLHTPAGVLRQRRPLVYQEWGGRRREIPGAYEQRPDGAIAFRVDEYDPSKPLVIDPVLDYSTYVGGDNQDVVNDIAVDLSGKTYFTGFTASEDFAGFAPSGGTAVVVGVLNESGTALLSTTILDGSDVENAFGIVLDGAGNILVVGTTFSSDFPATSDTVQPIYGGGIADAFVSKLTSAGILIASTYLGGDDRDEGRDVGVDGMDNVYVAVETASMNYPTTPGALQETSAGQSDAAFTKLLPGLGASAIPRSMAALTMTDRSPRRSTRAGSCTQVGTRSPRIFSLPIHFSRR